MPSPGTPCARVVLAAEEVCVGQIARGRGRGLERKNVERVEGHDVSVGVHLGGLGGELVRWEHGARWTISRCGIISRACRIQAQGVDGLLGAASLGGLAWPSALRGGDILALDLARGAVRTCGPCAVAAQLAPCNSVLSIPDTRRESKYRNMPRQKLHATAVFLGVAFFLGVEASWADWGRRRLAGWCSGGRASLKRSA